MEAKWCAPGDDQRDRWLVRFNDHDMRDALFTGPDAETEARAKWDMMCGPSGTWNGYLFRLAARPTADLGEDGELQDRIAAMLKRQRGDRYAEEAVAGDPHLVDIEDAREIVNEVLRTLRDVLSRSDSIRVG